MTGHCFYLFGGVRVVPLAPDQPRPQLTRTLQGLLAYLLINRHRAVRSDTLADVFWGAHPDDKARSSLSTALWRLRGALGSGPNDPEGLISHSHGEVGIRQHQDLWLDVDIFEGRTAVTLTRDVAQLEDDTARDLNEAVALYSGDALEGFYDDWALRERERLRLLFLHTLWYLMRFHSLHNNLEDSAGFGQRILYHDPLREEIHRELIRLYLRMGQRSLALRQYTTCCQVLDTELGIPPMLETRQLYEQMLSDSDARAVTTVPDAIVNFQQALTEARLARRGLQAAMDLLHRSVELMEKNAQMRKQPPA